TAGPPVHHYLRRQFPCRSGCDLHRPEILPLAENLSLRRFLAAVRADCRPGRLHALPPRGSFLCRRGDRCAAAAERPLARVEYPFWGDVWPGRFRNLVECGAETDEENSFLALCRGCAGSRRRLALLVW